MKKLPVTLVIADISIAANRKKANTHQEHDKAVYLFNKQVGTNQVPIK